MGSMEDDIKYVTPNCKSKYTIHRVIELNAENKQLKELNKEMAKALEGLMKPNPTVYDGSKADAVLYKYYNMKG